MSWYVVDVFAVSIQIKTLADGSYDTSGKFTPGAATTTTIRATVQPLNGEEMARLPAGRNVEEYLKVYLNYDIGDIKKNRIIIDSVEYEIDNKHKWKEPRSYWKLLVRKVS